MRLQTLAGPVATPSFELNGQFITIGRAQANALHLNHRSVSKYHALIVVEDGKAQLFDLHSTNGTYVNGQRVASCPLNANDELFIGEFHFRYEAAEAPAAQPVATAAPPAQPIPAPTPPTASPAPVVAPIPTAVPIAPAVAQKLAVSGPRSTTGSIPAQTLAAKPPPGRSFIRIPEQTPSEEKPGLIKKLIARHTGKVAGPTSTSTPAAAPITAQPSVGTSVPASSPSPTPAQAQPFVESPATAPAPEPVEPSAPAPSEPSAERPMVAAPTPKKEGLLVKKPTATGERVLVKPGSGGGDRVLKKPGGPKT
ncbi:MAG: FHA domain-containing protein [Verrucomicrobiae bacterium]|nr:FHA domain-containing protein [Verrucomicrobiae bacterium]